MLGWRYDRAQENRRIVAGFRGEPGSGLRGAGGSRRARNLGRARSGGPRRTRLARYVLAERGRRRRRGGAGMARPPSPRAARAPRDRLDELDRTSGGSGKSVSVRVDLGGRRIIKKT